MKIADQTVVTMTYILRENDENGALIQETTKEQPFTCIFGMHQLLPKFEEYLTGKEPGDKFAFHLSPEEGYGVRDPKMIIPLNKQMFCQDGKFMDELVKVGAELMMQDVNGNPIPGTVVAIDDTTVTMDFNHSLADKHLHFSGEILDVRESTDADFGEGEDCGCHCSDCHGDCGGHDNCDDDCHCDHCNK